MAYTRRKESLNQEENFIDDLMDEGPIIGTYRPRRNIKAHEQEKSDRLDYSPSNNEYHFEEADFPAEHSPRSTHGNKEMFVQNAESDSPIRTATKNKLRPNGINYKDSVPVKNESSLKTKERVAVNHTLENIETGYIGQHKDLKDPNVTSYSTNKQHNKSRSSRSSGRDKELQNDKFKKISKSPNIELKRKNKVVKRNFEVQPTTSHTQTSPVYSQNQLKSFSNAARGNSSSVVINDKSQTVDLAMKNKDLIKDKASNRKKRLNKSKQRMQKAKEYTKNISEQYQKEKQQFKSQQKGKSSVSRRLSRKQDLQSSDSISKLPYGLRRHLQNMASKSLERTGAEIEKEHVVSTFAHQDIHDLSGKTKIVDNHKKMVVPTTSDDLKKVLAIEDNRYTNKFSSQKAQDDLINRLLGHKDKISQAKFILKTEQDVKKQAELSYPSPPSTQRNQVKSSNKRSFYDNQIELEMLRSKRLALEMESKTQRELQMNSNPTISSKSKRLASSSAERRGLVHDRLHKQGKPRKQKLLKQAQDVMSNLSSPTEERSGS